MNKWNYNLQTFYNEDALTYYLLGAFMTDGCVHASKNRPNRKVVTLSSKDVDWLEIINDHICPEKPPINKGLNCKELMYCSTAIGDWLISKGCIPKKSLILEFPQVPEQYLKDFIRGCWDGDGSISFSRKGKSGLFQRQANLTSGSKKFCESLSLYLNRLNINCSVRQHNAGLRKIEGRILQPSFSWRVVVSGGNSVYNLCRYLYDDAVLAMPRKNTIAKIIIEEWERKILCINCGCDLCVDPSNNRNKKFCKECMILRIKNRKISL